MHKEDVVHGKTLIECVAELDHTHQVFAVARPALAALVVVVELSDLELNARKGSVSGSAAS